MIHKGRARTSSLFLMELILAILFFSITSAVCVQFFIKSHLLSQDSRILTQAVSECSATAEICSTSDGIDVAIKQLSDIYPYIKISETDNTAIIYFDSDLKPCAEKSKVYMLTVQLHENDSMLSSDITFEDPDADVKERTIYELSTQHHIARRTAK